VAVIERKGSADKHYLLSGTDSVRGIEFKAVGLVAGLLLGYVFPQQPRTHYHSEYEFLGSGEPGSASAISLL